MSSIVVDYDKDTVSSDFGYGKPKKDNYEDQGSLPLRKNNFEKFESIKISSRIKTKSPENDDKSNFIRVSTPTNRSKQYYEYFITKVSKLQDEYKSKEDDFLLLEMSKVTETYRDILYAERDISKILTTFQMYILNKVESGKIDVKEIDLMIDALKNTTEFKVFASDIVKKNIDIGRKN